MDKRKTIDELRKLVTEFLSQNKTQLEQIGSKAKLMQNACDRVKESWSGSCLGFHAKLYYGNFEKPPRGEYFSIEWGGINGLSREWKERTPEEVRKRIEQLIDKGFSVEQFENDIKGLSSKVEDFQKTVDIIVASITKNNTDHPFKSVEKIDPGVKKKIYIKNYTHRQWMTRDTEAITQGVIIPAIIYYEALIYETENIISNSEAFIKTLEHFIKWYELQGGVDANKPILTDLSLLHQDIYSKCQHLFETGEYAEAVEKGFKVVRDKLRSLTGFETGSEAFGKGKLHIKGAAATNVDQDFNEAVKFLTMAIDRFRNEKSHTSNAKIDDPQQAYEYLTISSLAMHLLDRAEILP